MGPFPHDAPQAEISTANPAGTNGFAFVEFAHPEPEKLAELFTSMGFAPTAHHKSRDITLWQQGDVTYVVTAEPESFAARFVDAHGPCAVSMGWRVVDAKHAFDHAVKLGAEPAGRDGLTFDVPTIKGIGGSLIYFIDDESGLPAHDEFTWTDAAVNEGAGLYYIDHLTHNVFRGRMDVWADWYGKLFNFRQIRFFDIEGKVTGLFSRAMTSPCGKIRIPINESADEQSQIEEYLRAYKGEGIQHIACGCRDIYASVEQLNANGLAFMPAPPDAYYNKVDDRLAGHGEPLERMAKHGILIDGEGVVDGGHTKVLLQIFSQTCIGPIFFEFIERKGDDGFGEGNFRALFESIEEDQIRRGVIKLDAAE
ncbi:MAG: 4-hydroxyphenylpyruvate dioxygenase [Hyphomicrobiales bacterium]